MWSIWSVITQRVAYRRKAGRKEKKKEEKKWSIDRLPDQHFDFLYPDRPTKFGTGTGRPVGISDK